MAKATWLREEAEYYRREEERRQQQFLAIATSEEAQRARALLDRRVKPGEFDPAIDRALLEENTKGARIVPDKEVDLNGTLLPDWFHQAMHVPVVAVNPALVALFHQTMTHTHGSLAPLTDYDDGRVPTLRPPETFLIRINGDPDAPAFLSAATREALRSIGLTTPDQLRYAKRQLQVIATNARARHFLESPDAGAEGTGPHLTSDELEQWLDELRSPRRLAFLAQVRTKFGPQTALAAESVVSEVGLEAMQSIGQNITHLPHDMWPPYAAVPVFPNVSSATYGPLAALRCVMNVKHDIVEKGYLVAVLFQYLLGQTSALTGLHPPLEPPWPPAPSAPAEAAPAGPVRPWMRPDLVLEYMTDLDRQGVCTVLGRWARPDASRREGLTLLRSDESDMNELVGRMDTVRLERSEEEAMAYNRRLIQQHVQD